MINPLLSLPDIEITSVRYMDIPLNFLRLDKIHPEISGNKWFKLRYNLQQVLDENHKGILTFGGAFSNHIAATAAASNLAGIHSTGIIRGEEEYKGNPTLLRAQQNGMELHFISRRKYRIKNHQNWLTEFPGHLIVPEGGSNTEGVRGASDIAELIPDEYKSVCLAVGTGGTIAGLSSALNSGEVIGFPVLKGYPALKKDIENLQPVKRPFRLVEDYHFGGYAKVTEELIHFINRFYKATEIKLDPVYTAKLTYGVLEEIKNGNIKNPVLIIHTGGLQGVEGMEERLGIRFFD